MGPKYFATGCFLSSHGSDLAVDSLSFTFLICKSQLRKKKLMPNMKPPWSVPDSLLFKVEVALMVMVTVLGGP